MLRLKENIFLSFKLPPGGVTESETKIRPCTRMIASIFFEGDRFKGRQLGNWQLARIATRDGWWWVMVAAHFGLF